MDVASSIEGATVNFTVGASGVGGENAFYDDTGKVLTINLAKSGLYIDSQINNLIENAKTEKSGNLAPAKIKWKTESGKIRTANFTTSSTVAGIQQDAKVSLGVECA